jgi:hypothetical protein
MTNERTIITVPANSYNDFTLKLYRMMVDVNEIKVKKYRYWIYDTTGELVATYDERKDHGLVYNYNNHWDVVGKELRF